jgi:hypothetical protein
MNPEKREFLSLPKPPARLTAEQVAWMLGFETHDIPTLLRAGLLRPLGTPAPNSPKHFALIEIQERMQDVRWLARASGAIQSHWRTHNARRKLEVVASQ